MLLHWDKDDNVKLYLEGNTNLSTTQRNNIIENSMWSSQMDVSRNDRFGWTSRKLNIAIDKGNEDVMDFSKYKCKETYSSYILKSTLDKCIKRGTVNRVVRVAWQYMRQDINALINNMCYLIAHNAIIHRQMLHCIWIKLAIEGGWKITVKQVLMVLNILNELTCCEYHDVAVTDKNMYQRQLHTNRKLFLTCLEVME